MENFVTKKHLGGFLLLIGVAIAWLSFLNSAQAATNDMSMQALWDKQPKLSKGWTLIASKAIHEYGQNLIKVVPADIINYCPAYAKLDSKQRTAFWVNLISTLALQESSFEADSSYVEHFSDSDGKSVISRGLLQLSYSDGSNYGCDFQTLKDLDDVSKNIECGVKIMDHLMEKDQRIAGKISGKYRGLSRYWGPFRDLGEIVLFQLSSSELEFCN
jgi:hypothetical protein